MPRYEFFCEGCQKPFEIILTLAEYEKGKIACPKCGGEHVHQEAAEFFAVTSKEKLKDVALQLVRFGAFLCHDLMPLCSAIYRNEAAQAVFAAEAGKRSGYRR